jgi:acetoin utilization protein AcuB
MKVKDIMTTAVLTANEDTKITKIAEVMFKNRIHAVPVVDGETVIGIIAEDDFFSRDASNIFLPSYIEFVKGTSAVNELVRDKKEKLDKLMNLEAKDIMTKECVSVLEDMDIAALLDFFRETKFTTLPVLNNEEKLVGIVSFSDIIGLIKA